MASLPFWDSEDEDEADVWTEVELGGHILPGDWNCKVKGKRKIDQQEGSGTDYDTSVDKGQRAADVRLTGKIYTREDFERFEDEVMPAIWPAAGKGKPDPKELYHPNAELYRVSAMVVADIESELNDDNIFEVTITGLAWGKPKPSPVKVADKAKGAQSGEKANPDKAAEQAPFNPEASLLDQLKETLDPKRQGGVPLGQGAPSRDPSLLKP